MRGTGVKMKRGRWKSMGWQWNNRMSYGKGGPGVVGYEGSGVKMKRGIWKSMG